MPTSTPPPTPARPHRLLVVDGSPGATALLLLAAHYAVRIDTAVVADTGWYPATVYRHLQHLEHLATKAGIGVHWVAAGGTAAQTRTTALPCPLALFTRTPDGIPGRLPNGCARRQTTALLASIHTQIEPTLANSTGHVDCVLGLGAQCARRAPTRATGAVRLVYPLLDIGWTTTDCRAYLHLHHNLDNPPPVACVACPQRSNAGWAHLRATDPEAFQDAVAVDAALRHDQPTAASGGMPPGTTCYLHPDRIPLQEAALDAGRATAHPGIEGCLPRACRAMAGGTCPRGGGDT